VVGAGEAALLKNHPALADTVREAGTLLRAALTMLPKAAPPDPVAAIEEPPPAGEVGVLLSHETGSMAGLHRVRGPAGRRDAGVRTEA
jgi:hypothetical protein